MTGQDGTLAERVAALAERHVSDGDDHNPECRGCRENCLYCEGTHPWPCVILTALLDAPEPDTRGEELRCGSDSPVCGLTGRCQYTGSTGTCLTPTPAVAEGTDVEALAERVTAWRAASTRLDADADRLGGTNSAKLRTQAAVWRVAAHELNTLLDVLEPDARNLALGDRLRDARVTHGLSYRQAAEQIGCTPSTVHKIEHGGDPRWSVVQRVLGWLEGSGR